MKKALCLILALILTCALMPAALAEYEPPVYEATEGTPYGIPLPTSVDDIDFAAVINGHTYRRLLDLVDNIEVKSDMHQDAQGQTFDMLIDDYYFLDDGQYVSYSIQNQKGSMYPIPSRRTKHTTPCPTSFSSMTRTTPTTT